MKEYNLEGFERGLFELGIKLSEEQKTQFLQYYELLVEWNSFMNLTAITEFDHLLNIGSVHAAPGLFHLQANAYRDTISKNPSEAMP